MDGWMDGWLAACLPACLHVCLSVCLSVCPSQANPHHQTWHGDSSEMRMHHVLIILTLTFIQSITDRNRDNNTCLTISETIQAMPITFDAMIVRIKVYNYDPCQSDNRDLHSRSQVRFKTLVFNLQYLGQYLSYYIYIQTWHGGILMDAIYAHARFDDLDLDAKKNSSLFIVLLMGFEPRSFGSCVRRCTK